MVGGLGYPGRDPRVGRLLGHALADEAGASSGPVRLVDTFGRGPVGHDLRLSSPALPIEYRTADMTHARRRFRPVQGFPVGSNKAARALPAPPASPTARTLPSSSRSVM